MSTEISLMPNSKQVPTVQRFITLIVNELADRRNLLVAVPLGIDVSEACSMIKAELWYRDFDLELLNLDEHSEKNSPLEALCTTLGVKWPSSDTPQTCENFLIHSNGLPNVLLIEGIKKLTDEARKHWMDFLMEWVQSCHSAADSGIPPMALCIVAPGVAVINDLPQTDTHLGIHWWWGFPSALEVQLLCRLNTENQNWDAEKRWREYLLPSLSGTDVSLAEFLWNYLTLNIDDLILHLSSLAKQRGWEAESLKTLGAYEKDLSSTNNNGHFTTFPPESFQALWAHGILIWSLEFGLELNTAALAVMERKQEIKHRLWRAQAELLLPIIDSFRLNICERFTNLYGQNWPLRWGKPLADEEIEAVKKNPLACQLGYLEYLLKNCRQLKEQRKWIPLVALARNLRNNIAHYHPILYDHFETLLNKIQEFEDSTSSMNFYH